MTPPPQERSEPPETPSATSTSEEQAASPPASPGKTPDLPASSEDPNAPPGEPAEQSGSPPAERAEPGRRAQPVTVTMLKAAARSPEDVKEIVRVESRLREKKRAQPVEEGALTEAPPAGETPSQTPSQTRPSGTSGEQAPAQTSPAQPSPAQTSPAQTSPAQSTPGRPSPTQQATAAPAAGAAKAARAPAQARAPQPTPPKRATPPPAQARATQPTTPPERSTPPEAIRADPPSQPAATPPQRPSSLPIAAAILAAGALVTWAIRSSQPLPPSASASPAVAAASPSARSPGALPEPPPATPSRRGTLASFGRDHVVYSDGSGELVILKGDAVSGELTLERVYVVRRDRQRDLGDAARPLHGVYLDDLHLERAEELRAATLEFKTRLAEAHRKREGLELVDAAAVRLARAGGANLLIPLLEPTHPTLDRRAATIGLLESRYRCALPHVAGLIRRYKDGPQGRRLCELSGALIGQRLDPREPEAAAAAIEAWCREHPLLDRFEQVSPSTGVGPPR